MISCPSPIAESYGGRRRTREGKSSNKEGPTAAAAAATAVSDLLELCRHDEPTQQLDQ